MYLYIDNGDFGLSFGELCRRHPDTSFPQGVALPCGYVAVPPPPYNPRTHAVRELAPVGGIQQWEVIERSQEDVAAQERDEIASKVDRLWSAADRYVTGSISGVAIGILAIGVMQGKPKALAISAWSGGVWADYYQRKAAVLAGEDVDTDFGKHGPIPHSVPELQQEVGF